MGDASVILGRPQNEYGSAYHEHILQVYRTYVEIADKIGARRETANSFFLTLNTGLLGVLGFLAQGSGIPLGRAPMVPVALAGVVVALLWRRILRSYREVSAAKYRVIHQLEEYLPIRPYTAERQALGAGREGSRYTPLSRVEGWIPLILALLHGLIALWAVSWDHVARVIGAG